MSYNCAVAFKGVPKSCLDGNGMILPSGLWFTKEGYSKSTLANAGTKEIWDQAIIDGNVSFVHGVKEVENVSGEDAIYESPGQDKIFLFSGRNSLKYSVYVTPDQHKALLTFNGNKGRCGWYDRNNNITGTSPDGTLFQGFKLSYLRVGDLMPATDANPAWTTIELQYADNTEMNEKLHLVRPDVGDPADAWYAQDLDTLTQVSLEQVGAIATNTITFDVFGEESSITGNDGNSIKIASIDGLDVTGTPFENFTLTIDGVVTEPDTATDEGVVDGKARYTITQTTIGAAVVVTLAIKPSLTHPYESETITAS
jgi:hypothetical protein